MYYYYIYTLFIYYVIYFYIYYYIIQYILYIYMYDMSHSIDVFDIIYILEENYLYIKNITLNVYYFRIIVWR